ncbi:unnamed protein product [Ceutorhynchus assimilis]|uniref:MD-2-related lipid-recognition domain-containing protein n=1 Tax=Ceutorhynchus assimilis TaxID=467358 RepID=A0A9N9QJK5_9CUCU|nr:unnamed protein product [Ceutorhynchus assimilis]
MFNNKICFILATISFVVGDIEFMDCGSDVFVDHVEIDGCVESPCPIVRGKTYDVYITPVHLDPRVDSIEVETYIQVWGAYFLLQSACTNPCGTACPLRQPVDMPRLKFTIEFPRTLHRNPAELHIVAKLKNRIRITSEICVSVGVELF